MASRTSPEINDWVDVEPNDWQDVPANATAPSKPGNPWDKYVQATGKKPVSVPMAGGNGAVAKDDKPVTPLSTVEKVLTTPLAVFASGLTQTGRGAVRIKEGAKKLPSSPGKGLDEIAGGASDVVRGLGTAAAPAVLPVALATAPVPTIAALGVGIPAATVVEKGSKALGVPEGTSELLGTGAGIAAGGWAGKGWSGNPKDTGGLGGLARRAKAVDPTIAIVRAYRPTPSDPGFQERLPDTLANVKAANGGVAPKTNEEVIPAIDKAIESHKASLGKWFQRAKGVRVPGDSIIQATKDAISQMLPSEQANASGLVDRAVTDYGKGFTVEQLKARLELLNKRMDPFYSKNPGKQSAALADIPESVLKAQRDAVAESLYQALDPEGSGAGPRTIQKQIGDMIDLKDAALRRRNAITAERPINVIEKAGNVVKGPIRHLVPSKTGLAFSDTMQAKSDPLIRRAFEAVGDAKPLPVPSGFYPTGAQGRLLGPPTLKPPVPADLSYVRGVPGVANAPNPARALPPASTIFAPPAGAGGYSPSTQYSPLFGPSGPTYGVNPSAIPPDASYVGSVPATYPPKLPRLLLPPR